MNRLTDCSWWECIRALHGWGWVRELSMTPVANSVLYTDALRLVKTACGLYRGFTRPH